MSKKGSLFLLIKSLTKTEKRYFRLYTATGKGDANYIRLFDAIDRQEQYDEEAIRGAFETEAFVNQLHVAKIYLAELILKSLRNYHANDSVNSQLLDLIKDVEILYRKELYHASLLKIEKAEKLANRYEKTVLLLEIISWKRKLIITMGYSDSGFEPIISSEKKPWTGYMTCTNTGKKHIPSLK